MTLSTRIAAVSAALALAGAALLVGVPAEAAPQPSPAGSPTTWSVVPAGTHGADGRQAFAYSVSPGSLIQDEVAVANRGTTAETFRIYATDAFTDKQSGAFSLLVGSAKPKDVGSWVRTLVAEQEIQPDQEVRIPFQLSVPSNATPGDHTGGIIASVTVNGKSGSRASVKIEERVAARVYLHVTGPQTARVTSVGQGSSYTPQFNPFAPGTTNVDYAVRNTGNVRVDVAQTIVVTGPFGMPITTIQGPRIRNLLPGDEVQEEQRATAWPVLLLWTTVKLTALPPTDTVSPDDVRTMTGATAAAEAAPTYRTSSADTLGAAIPIVLLLIVIVIAALAVGIARYVRVTRERIWAELDSAERARAEHESLVVQNESHAP